MPKRPYCLYTAHYITPLDRLLALGNRLHLLGVAQDRQRLFERFKIFRVDEDGRGLVVPGDDEPLMVAMDPLDKIGETISSSLK